MTILTILILMIYEHGRMFHLPVSSVISESYQTFKEEPAPMLFKFSYKIEREELLPNSLYKASITLIQNPIRIQKENQFP
jgi:hypothetical protein